MSDNTPAAEQAEIAAFFRQNPLATIATVNNATHHSESALIAFVELESFEILFETFVDTRKFQNLQTNPHVSLVVGWGIPDYRTLQYEGEAHQIMNNDVEKYRKIFLQKETPCTEEFLLDSRARLFKITPDWLRYSDYRDATPRIIEIKF